MSSVAWAATAEKNSVTSKSIREGAVGTSEIADDSVLGRDVHDDTLTGRDIDESTLDGARGPEGPAGPTGETGATGPQGPAGPVGTLSGVAAGGDLTGTYPNPEIGPSKVGGAEVANGALTGDDIDESTLTGLVTSNRDARVFGSGRVTSNPPNATTLVELPNLIDTGTFSVDATCESGGSTGRTVNVLIESTEANTSFTAQTQTAMPDPSIEAVGQDLALPLISAGGGTPGNPGFFMSDFIAMTPSGKTISGKVIATAQAQGAGCAFSVVATEVS